MRIIALSSISNMGVLFAPLQSGDFMALYSSLLYILSYLLIVINLLTLLFAFQLPNHRLLLTTTNDLRFLVSPHPYLALLLALSLFSLSAIPPLAGFFPKFWAIFVTTQTSNFFYPLLLIVFSAISAFFYLQFIVDMYFKHTQSFAPILPVSSLSIALIYLSSSLNILFIFFLPFFSNQILISLQDIYNPWFF